jgi:hypothetical protein
VAVAHQRDRHLLLLHRFDSLPFPRWESTLARRTNDDPGMRRPPRAQTLALRSKKRGNPPKKKSEDNRIKSRGSARGKAIRILRVGSVQALYWVDGSAGGGGRGRDCVRRGRPPWAKGGEGGRKPDAVLI